jgi:hypothetical protein
LKRYWGIPAGETWPILATSEREVRSRSDPRKEGEVMARSVIMQKIENLSEGRLWKGRIL